jgi:hypothetical protein
MYADDTNITAHHTNINKVEDVLNKDLDILKRWLQANKLSLNVLKSEYMLIGSKVRINKLTSDPKIFIGGHRLKRVVVTNPWSLRKLYIKKSIQPSACNLTTLIRTRSANLSKPCISLYPSGKALPLADPYKPAIVAFVPLPQNSSSEFP